MKLTFNAIVNFFFRKMLKREMLKIVGNIRRFDDKEQGTNYYAGWDNALDTVIMDIKEY